MIEAEHTRVRQVWAALVTAVLLAADCGAAKPEIDPWQTSPLEEAAGRCDLEELEDLLHSMRRRGRPPNQRDLHHPEGTVARFVTGCGSLNPALSAAEAEVLRTLLEMAGHEASVESVRSRLVLAGLDRTAMVLPETRTRSAVPAGAAIVSVTESGVVRVSSGGGRSVVVPGPEDVLLPFR